jgi:hypothetical protein
MGEILSIMLKSQSIRQEKQGVVSKACNSITWEAEAEGSDWAT